MKVILLLAVFVFGGVIGDTSPFGTTFYIPVTNLLNRDLKGGLTILQDLQTDCIKTDYQSSSLEGIRSRILFGNTGSFYNYLTSATAMSSELGRDFTMGYTLDKITNGIGGSKREIRGASVEAYSMMSEEYILDNCIGSAKLIASLTSAFENLPKSIEKQWLHSQWTTYQIFIEKFGSHFVNRVHYGSSLQQYSFSNASDNYTEWVYNVAACGKLAGYHPVENISLPVCAGITRRDVETVSKLPISSQLILRGGTTQTRADLYANPNNELIEKFLNEANSTHSPIQYKYMPIWELLKRKYYGTEHHVKAINLEAYYLGFMNFGCDYVQTKNNVELQKFVLSELSTPQYPIYKCTIVPAACQTFDDCHYYTFGCNCYGNSAIGHKIEALNIGEDRTVPYIKTHEGTTCLGCAAHLFTCYCEAHDLPWDTIWDQGPYLFRNHIL